MFMELLSGTVLAGRLINDKIQQNKPYYGTERDIFKNNPRVQENRKAVNDIITKHKAEYIQKHWYNW